MKATVRTLGKLIRWNAACAVLALCAGTVVAARAQTFTLVASFDGTDGQTPAVQLLQGGDGYLYGATENKGAYGWGTIFKVSTTGTLTTVHNFTGKGGADPDGALIQTADGTFYGTTFWGGTATTCTHGCGTVFKMTRSGQLTTLHSFDTEDGSGPIGPLVQGSDGAFYGATTAADSGTTCPCGTVFRISSKGAFTTLHTFTGMDGSYPGVPLILGTDGNFYGTTTYGGLGSCEYGCGTIFKLTAGGALTTLYSFSGPDGYGPFALAQAVDGNFYGVTGSGGLSVNCFVGCGTVFKMTPAGVLTTLYNFSGTDGYGPIGLIQGTDGNLYGTTQLGGPSYGPGGEIGNNGYGTIFEISTEGALTTLYSFDGVDETQPLAGLVQSTDGVFYGSVAANMNGYGRIFSISVGLGPFVRTGHPSGKVGAVVEILGTNLTGATSVTFNGTPSPFKVDSNSLIVTTVPTGATSGTIQVVTPSGTLSSYPPFRVLP